VDCLFVIVNGIVVPPPKFSWFVEYITYAKDTIIEIINVIIITIFLEERILYYIMIFFYFLRRVPEASLYAVSNPFIVLGLRGE
jgi:hypothetical protein